MSAKKQITTCQDYLSKTLLKTYKGGGNGDNLYSNLNDIAIHLDTASKESKKGFRVVSNKIYGKSSVDAFKKLCDCMSRDEVTNNSK